MVAQCNTAPFKTLDGISKGGTRLYEEVMQASAPHSRGAQGSLLPMRRDLEHIFAFEARGKCRSLSLPFRNRCTLEATLRSLVNRVCSDCGGCCWTEESG